MKMSVYTFLLIFGTSTFLHAVKPTEVRQWETTSGHSTEAKALSASLNTVKLELSSGKVVDLALTKLIENDRKFLSEHFEFKIPKEGEPTPSGEAPISADAVKHPIGSVVGPLKASDISTYYLYIPKSLKAGRKAPLLHYNDSSPVNPGKMSKLKSACDRFGWVLVGSVESRNGNTTNIQCALDNVADVMKLGITDPERVYFTGNSGGGAISWWNCQFQKGAGTIPMNAYIHYQMPKLSKGHHYVVGGARDFNRYHSANAANRFKDDAVYRPYPGAHSFPKADHYWIFEDALGWLTMRFLMTKQGERQFAGERLDFESNMIHLSNDLVAKDKPHVAYHILRNLQEVYEISGPNAAPVAILKNKLASENKNVLFSDGLNAIHDFGVDDFSKNGTGGTKRKTVFPDDIRKVEKLLETYADVPFVTETLKELKEPSI